MPGLFEPTLIRQGKVKPEDEGYYREAAMRFKEKIDLPLMLTGGIRSYQTAKRFIEQGVADYIGLSRPLICEPELINRWKSGDIRPSGCISDNSCLKSLLEGNRLRCDLRTP
ncbi:MAG TPA: hypothetical protein VN455_11895 [Methanotrichaceae archaeon]|nr:hypothetical protein [Methanotrichaceae archaeon]